MGEEKSNSAIWCLFHGKTKLQYRHLTLGEAQSLVSESQPKEMSAWFVWKPGWTNWKRALDCEEFLHISFDGRKRSAEIPPQPPMIPSGTRRQSDQLATEPIVFEAEKTLQEFELDDKDFTARRYRRLKKKFKVEVELNGKVFTSYSKDISVGGILLVDPLPNWVAGYARVRIISLSSGQNVELTGSVVENQKPNLRHRIELYPLERMERLQGWLTAS